MSGAKKFYLVGRSGSGKSTIADMMAAPSKRLVVFDYLQVDGALKRQRRLKLTKVTTLQELKAQISKKYSAGFRLWYVPPMDDQVEALHQVSLLLWNVQERVHRTIGHFPLVTLYVDELSHGFPVYQLPKTQRGFYRLCTAGRHYGINLIGASQRPAQVNTEFRGNLDARYLFSLSEAADFEAARKLGGKGAEHFTRTAPKFRYMRIGEGGAVTFGVTRP